MADIIVLGAGVMGLAAAHRALALGHRVTLLEAGAQAGGMAAHFDFAGLSIERYYHFVCKTDQPTFDLLRELGLLDQLHWRNTSMGCFIDNTLHPWGDPIALLRFPHLNVIEKLRYGLLMFLAVRRDAWPALEQVSARAWLERWCGRSVYQKLWRPLFDFKFYDHADTISAAWMWRRIRRVGRSRRSLMTEELGYIEGGSQRLVDALMRAIIACGGVVHLATPARRVIVADGRVAAVEAAGGRHVVCSAVISTVPTPLVGALLPDLPAEGRAAYDRIQSIGVICVVLKLKQSVSRHFWVNVIDPDLPIPGIIEFSNLRPIATGETLVYVPYYLPPDHPLWRRSDQGFIDEAMTCLHRVNGAIMADDLIAAQVNRLRHAQPICPPGFLATLPPIQTPIAGLQIADTCYYYPEDRGIAESVRLGQAMAEAVGSGGAARSTSR